MKKGTLALLILFAHFSCILYAQTTWKIQADKPVAEIQPTMWGIFFEDINYGADGGLYAELVKNRSFEFDTPMMGWKEVRTDRFSNNEESGSAMILNRGLQNESNSRFARVRIYAEKTYAMINEGFFGMGIKKDLAYHFSIDARQVDGNVALLVELVDDKDNVIGSATVKPDTKEWKKYKADLVSNATFAKSKLRLSFTGTGIIDIDMVSLFPSDTWKNRPGGLRADLVQLLSDLKPGFLRFPGGCIVEGRDLETRYQWKKTVGNVDERALLINRWNTEFKHRPAPDYFQSFGLGFFEYFQLAEDIGASPLPILSCGMACQFNTAELVPVDQLDPYIQDALDLIEFANGPVTSKWGKLRAEMGHPAPFNLKMIGVGNEQWGSQYIERYKIFQDAIQAKYPDIKIVSGSGPFSDGELFDYAWQELKSLKTGIVDEHYYKNPEWFLQNAARYDKYDRNGPKVFAGEYAAQSSGVAKPDNKNNWQCALSEAAFMTGLERNADVVHLASYAPLLAHAEGWQWTPDLIWFDNLQAYGTPNYYVQKLFSNNKGTHVLPIKSGNENIIGQNKLFASAVVDEKSKEIIIKVVNAGEQPQSPEIQISGRKLSANGTIEELKGSLDGTNSFDNPQLIRPISKSITIKGKTIEPELAPNSFAVIKIKYN
jgi:alpha-L-arabinofuranosidase